MPSIETEPVGTADEENSNEEATLSGPVVGIIYPPPEVRSILFFKYKDQFFFFSVIIF